MADDELQREILLSCPFCQRQVPSSQINAHANEHLGTSPVKSHGRKRRRLSLSKSENHTTRVAGARNCVKGDCGTELSPVGGRTGLLSNIPTAENIKTDICTAQRAGDKTTDDELLGCTRNYKGGIGESACSHPCGADKETAQPDVASCSTAQNQNADCISNKQRSWVFEVVGRKFTRHKIQSARSVSPGECVTVSRQYDNPADSNALMVLTADGVELGYLRRELAAALSPCIDAGSLQVDHCRCVSWSMCGRCTVSISVSGSNVPEQALQAMDQTDTDDTVPSDDLSEFQLVCDTVLERDSELFTADEHSKLGMLFTETRERPDCFERNTATSVESAAFLAVKLFRRKGPWFRVAQRQDSGRLDAVCCIGMPWVHYPEISDTAGGIALLKKMGFLLECDAATGISTENIKTPASKSRTQANELEELSTILTVNELKSLVSELKLRSTANSKAALLNALACALHTQLRSSPHKGTLLRHFRRTSKGATTTTCEAANALYRVCGHCIRLTKTAVKLFNRAELLFFLDSARLNEPQSVFVMQRLGRLRFVPYKVKPISVFPDKEVLEQYQDARYRLDEIKQLHDCGSVSGAVSHSRVSAGISGTSYASDDHRRQRLLLLGSESAEWLTINREWDICEADSTTECIAGANIEAKATQNLFMRRFRAGWVHARIVSSVIPLLESAPLRDHQTAVSWLRKLLRSPLLPSSRASWWNRLTIDLGDHRNLACFHEAWQECRRALEDLWDENQQLELPPEYSDIRKRYIALSSKLTSLSSQLVEPRITRNGREVTLVDPTKRKGKVSRPPVEVIRGRAVNSKPSEKSLFFGFDNELGSVENLALQYYASKEGGSWQGVHDEGATLRTLFGLCLWDAIWASGLESGIGLSIPGVFQTQFQNAPLDFWTDAFYPSRRVLIESILKRVDSARQSTNRWTSLLQDVWAKYHGFRCVGVSWDMWSLPDLVCVAASIGGAVLSKCFRKLAKDYRTWSCGLPDILLWRTDVDGQLQAKWSEVKSQRDRESAKQSDWLACLVSFGAKAVILRVAEEETRRESEEKLSIRRL